MLRSIINRYKMQNPRCKYLKNFRKMAFGIMHSGAMVVSTEKERHFKGNHIGRMHELRT
jgi:hypothetical protein